jgi:hypothetical protein
MIGEMERNLTALEVTEEEQTVVLVDIERNALELAKIFLKERLRKDKVASTKVEARK